MFALALTSLQCGNPPNPGGGGGKRDDGAAPAPARVPEFDAASSFALLKAQTAFGPRVPGTPAHDRCLSWLRGELVSSGADVSLQPFTHTGYDGTPLPMTNLFASINPGAAKRILLVAHWDSRPRADQDPDPAKRALPIAGANDGASGVAVLLQIARVCKAASPPAGVDLLLVDGEDYGREGDSENYLLGSRWFARHLPAGYRPQFGIVLDMIGDRDLAIPREPYSIQYAPDIVELVWGSAAELGVRQFVQEEQRYVLDDHIPLNEAGIKTIDLIDFDYPYWHTTADTDDKCSPESLSAVGRVLLHVIYRRLPGL